MAIGFNAFCENAVDLFFNLFPSIDFSGIFFYSMYEEPGSVIVNYKECLGSAM
jgi:hypothetical protein